MGEVYRARDARLGREVAIKVLPAEVATDASRLRRFEKEARSASALNHPNIVTIYEIGSAGSVSYIAMERVEGETLRKVLMGGSLPLRKLLPIAAQIADGLARAHEAGIVHRDLKPENVMVTKDGRVKILDFGLAKLAPALDGAEGTNLPTETGTGAGVILGTVGYMSPEQASGQPVDFRSDQFSFGSMLYELVTGRRAFQKKTGVDTLSAILNAEPEPIAAISPQAPAPLRWIVERCLAKETEGRYDSTKDLARELRSVSDHLAEPESAGGTAIGAAPRRPVLWAAVTALAIALGIGAAKLLWKAKVADPPRSQQVTFQKASIYTATFAPDGQTILYSAQREDGRQELFQTRPGSRGSRPMGISDGLIASVSASGEMALIQESDGALVTAPLGGGEPRPLVPDVSWADWAPDGKSLAILRGEARRGRLEFPIGNLLYEPASGRIRVSPMGDRVAFIESGRRLAVVDRKKAMKVLAEDVFGFDWSPEGTEVWFTRITGGSTHLCAVNLAGRERPLASLPGDFVFHDVSRQQGRVLLERGFDQWHVVGRFPGDEREHSYDWLDSTVAHDLSPDGKTLLFIEIEPGRRNAMSYTRKTDGSGAVPLGEGFCTSLSPDGKWALCSESPPRNLKLVSTSGETRQLPNGGLEFKHRPGRGWLPDGKGIVFTANAPGRPSRIYVQSIDGSAPVPVTPESVSILWFAKAVSSDGRFVVGVHEGRAALYPLTGGSVIPVPGLERGDLPMQWSADSHSLYLQREESPGKIWLLDLATGRRRLFKEVQPPAPSPAAGKGWLHNLFITPDGQHYVATYQGWLADLFVLDGLK